jgi:hypothetical protein
MKLTVSCVEAGLMMEAAETSDTLHGATIQKTTIFVLSAEMLPRHVLFSLL